jgi:hypothetical protein
MSAQQEVRGRRISFNQDKKREGSNHSYSPSYLRYLFENPYREVVSSSLSPQEVIAKI